MKIRHALNMVERFRWFEAFPHIKEILSVPPTVRKAPPPEDEKKPDTERQRRLERIREIHQRMQETVRQIQEHPWSQRLVARAAKDADMPILTEDETRKIIHNVVSPSIQFHLGRYETTHGRVSSFLNKYVYADTVSRLKSGTWRRSPTARFSPARKFLLTGETKNLNPEDVRALIQFFENRIKKRQERELEKETVLRSYLQIAEKLSWTFETEEERLRAKRELEQLANEKAEKTRYYSMADFIRMFGKGDKAFLRGVTIHLGWETAEPQEKKRIIEAVKKWKSYVMAHEEGHKGIFLGHMSDAGSIQKHEFTHAARRVRGLEWFEDHDAVYSAEVLEALQRRLIPRTDIPEEFWDAVAVAYDAFQRGVKARYPREAWRYLQWYYTVGQAETPPVWQSLSEELAPFRSKKQKEKWEKRRQQWEKQHRG